MRDSVRCAIEEELERQNDKWGEQNHRDEIWFLILAEEVGELGKEILGWIDPKVPTAELVAGIKGELVQVAAVAAQWMEALERRGW